MTNYEVYVFFLCLIVYIMLTGLSVLCLTIIMRQSLKLIRAGVEDESILKEYRKNKDRKMGGCFSKIVEYSVSALIAAFFLVALIVSLLMRSSNCALCDVFPTYRVVQSNSMANIHGENDYVWENHLTDQIQTFDLIRTEKLPAENELELYDIVVYQHEDVLVVHRIVEIEEPNEEHPFERWFTLQGDAIEFPDREKVTYDRMCGIYTGKRIPYVGSFVVFMQSPAGWMCTLLIVVAMVATPLLEKKLQAAKNERIAQIWVGDDLDGDGKKTKMSRSERRQSREQNTRQEVKQPTDLGGKHG